MTWPKKLLRISVVAVVGTAATIAHGAQKRSLRSAQIPENWSVGEGSFEGKLIITSFNMGLEPFIGDSEFPNQLGIVVPFRQRTANGSPVSAEMKDLQAIEDEIIKRFTIGNESVYAGRVTTDNMREFVLYTSDAKAASAKAEKLRKDIRTHTIQFQIHSDPAWQNFKDLAPK